MKKIKLLLFTLLVAGIANAQITFTTQSIGTNHSDRGIVDMNGDHLDDVISVSANTVQIFYQNDGGGFTEANISTPTADYTPSWSLAAGDYDGNGLTDLLYGGGQGVTFMKAMDSNTGDSNPIDGFIEVSGSEYVFSQRSNFVDINNDGHLDAFVCHDVEPNVYYINDGNGNFTFNQGGLGDYSSGGHYGSVWVDFDNDRDIDMFIAKCGGESARRDNEMHRNNGAGTYTEIGADLGLEDDMSTWSSAWADYDNDGDMDAWIGASTLGQGFHRLMRNNGNGTFTDVITGSGLDGFTDTNIENQTYDFDNDGYTDIISSGSILYGNGDMTFTIQGGAPFNGGFGDVNNDGFIDVMGFGSLRINDGNSNNWVKFATEGVESNSQGIGARVEILTASGTQIRDVRSGEGFGNMSSLNTHFGLGTDDAIASVTVYWPSGTIDIFEDLDINQMHVLQEGDGVLGINDALVANLILYPNPTTDFLNISEDINFDEPIYTVFDAAGRRVMHGRLNDSRIDVTSLANGNYFLRLINNSRRLDRNTIKTQKFTKR
jgi:hypothetical protein